MNRKLLALAVGAAFALPVAGMAAPTVYGQLDLSLDRVNTDAPLSVPPVAADFDRWEVNSNSSRIGVKGEEALGNGLSAVYMAEWGVAGDVAGATAPGTDLNARNRYIGLKGDFGTVRLGAYDSPLKEAQGMVDQFNDMRYADMSNAVYGETRMSDAVGYTSPKLADAITLKAVIQPGESVAVTKASSRLANAYSFSATFEQEGIYASLGFNKKVNEDVTTGSRSTKFSATPGDARDTLRLVGSYTVDAVQLGVMLQKSEASDDAPAVKDDETAILLSAAYSLDDKNVIKGQIISSKDSYVVGSMKINELALGYDHKFTKMTKVYAQGIYAETDFGAGGKQKDSVLTVGMQTKF